MSLDRHQNICCRSLVVEISADVIVDLMSAQASIRYSLENPRAYVEAHFVGTFNLQCDGMRA